MKRLPNSERRIIRSDQRRGRPFEESAIEIANDGWLKIIGTRAEAEALDVRPQILEYLQGEDEVNERDVRSNVAARGWVVGQALRSLFKAGEVERTGSGRRGTPFLYSKAQGLSDLPSTSSHAGLAGLESGGGGKDQRTDGLMLVPPPRDGNPLCFVCETQMSIESDIYGNEAFTCPACEASTAAL